MKKEKRGIKKTISIKKSHPFIYWIPRILSILFLLFLAMFSLDVIEPGIPAEQIVLGLFMHNVPVFILAMLLILSWRFEMVGMIVFILAGLLYILFTVRADIPWYMAISWSLTIAGPAFAVGILFYLNYKLKKKIIH